jgi:hypothetical protein
VLLVSTPVPQDQPAVVLAARELTVLLELHHAHLAPLVRNLYLLKLKKKKKKRFDLKYSLLVICVTNGLIQRVCLLYVTGQYGTSTGASSCTSCSAGYYASATGSTSCTICPAG